MVLVLILKIKLQERIDRNTIIADNYLLF